jgi:hypothetical protein
MKRATLLLLLAPLLTCPSDAGGQTRSRQAEAERVDGGQITPVTFCELIKRPRLYFGKVVRLTATYQMGHEAAYLEHFRCMPGWRGRVGVGFVETDEGGRAALRREVERIADGEYGNARAKVTVVGVLRDEPDTGFGGYRYRFDVMRFEEISRDDVPDPVITYDTIITYDGTLQAGKVYRAKVRGDRLSGVSLVPPPRPLIHHALRVEWTNLDGFPELKRLRRRRGTRGIIFTVLFDEIEQMTERRWNRTLWCKVISYE